MQTSLDNSYLELIDDEDLFTKEELIELRRLNAEGPSLKDMEDLPW